jgi:hypothetical protein
LGIVAASNMASGLMDSQHNLLQKLPFDGQWHNPVLTSEIVIIIINIWGDAFLLILENNL